MTFASMMLGGGASAGTGGVPQQDAAKSKPMINPFQKGGGQFAGSILKGVNPYNQDSSTFTSIPGNAEDGGEPSDTILNKFPGFGGT